MKIKKVSVEYDERTYIAEGDSAISWLAWMQEAEEHARKAHRWLWDNWTRIETNDPGTQVVDGPKD
ncbi:MAG: hypothetical protein MUP49_02200 [Dehalococcoidia bacterium]|nr:hypothetical protein [Dehalococcoidia bacterium]